MFEMIYGRDFYGIDIYGNFDYPHLWTCQYGTSTRKLILLLRSVHTVGKI